MRIAVLGGGNGAYAAAADLAEQGHEVRLWRRDRAAFAPVLERGALVLKDFKGARRVPLALATAELCEALGDAELVLAPIPATGQEALGEALAPHLVDGQVVFLPPGSFGSFVIARKLRALGSPARVGFAEAGTLPYLARKHGADTIAITTRATRLPSGVYPYKDAEHIFGVVGAAYPAVERLTDALDGALMNAGPIIHPPLIILNAGPIQHFEHWDIHNEGTQPMIRRVADALDAERIRLRETLGYGAPHFPLADHYDDEAEEWMYGNAAHERLTDSGDWREPLNLATHRYMREDVAIGLAFMVSVGDWLGVPTPLASGLVAIASAMLGGDLRQGPRTLEGLGLAGETPASLQALLREGFAS